MLVILCFSMLLRRLMEKSLWPTLTYFLSICKFLNLKTLTPSHLKSLVVLWTHLVMGRYSICVFFVYLVMISWLNRSNLVLKSLTFDIACFWIVSEILLKSRSQNHLGNTWSRYDFLTEYPVLKKYRVIEILKLL